MGIKHHIKLELHKSIFFSHKCYKNAWPQQDVLALRQAAKQAFDEYVKEHGKDSSLPRLKDLHAEYATVLERKKKTYAEYRKQKSEMQDYLMAQKIVEVMLEKDDREKERQQLQQEQNRKQRWKYGVEIWPMSHFFTPFFFYA